MANLQTLTLCSLTFDDQHFIICELLGEQAGYNELRMKEKLDFFLNAASSKGSTPNSTVGKVDL